MVLFWFREGRQLSRVLIKPAVIDWRSTAFSYRDRRLTSRTMNSSGSGLPKCEHPRPAPGLPPLVSESWWRWPDIYLAAGPPIRFQIPARSLIWTGVAAPPRRASLAATRPPQYRPTHFPIVRGSAIDGHGWSAGDARNHLLIRKLGVVARVGLEPTTSDKPSPARKENPGAGPGCSE